MSKILVVDDDRDICGLLEFKLTAAGHSVRVENDGEAGLAALRESDIDLLVLDWMMPRLNGIDLCMVVRADEQFRKVPIILLTAKDQEADVQRGFDAGIDDFIPKPFSPREVQSRVEAVLRRSAR